MLTSVMRCHTKETYKSGRAAKNSAWYLRPKYGKRRKYRCNICGKWHLTKELRGPMVKTSDFESENSGSSPGEAAKVERREVTINLKEWDEDFNIPLVQFIEELNVLLNACPQEYREEVFVNFDKRGSDYDSSSGELSVWYGRAETDEELQDRAANFQRYEEQRRHQEFRTYQALKAKFG